MIFSLLYHVISFFFFFFFSLSLSSASFIFLSALLSPLSLYLSLSHNPPSSSPLLWRQRRSPSPMPLQATCLRRNLPDLTKIRFTSSTRQQLTSSTRQAAHLSSGANAARLCRCRSPRNLLHLHRCCRNLLDLTKIRFPLFVWIVYG